MYGTTDTFYVVNRIILAEISSTLAKATLVSLVVVLTSFALSILALIKILDHYRH
jgi:hypothetical protein